MSEVTTHDIEANGKTYILEWTHSDEQDGYIAITQTCDAGDYDEHTDCQLETYDFKECI